jgi:polar amino acid transport system substrate-binding protein
VRIILLFLIIITSPFAFSKSINVAWNPWCPWVCESAQKPGFSAELVDEVFKYSDIMVQFQKYSWPSALFEAREGRVVGLLPPAKNEAQGFIFPQEAAGFQQMCFYLNNGFNWSYKNINSLNNISFAVSEGNNYPGLMNYIDKNSNIPSKVQLIGTEDVFTIGFSNLKKNKYKAFVTDYIPAEYYLNKNNLNQEFKKSSCLPKEKFYIAFSPKNKEKSILLAKIFDENIIKIKKNGEFKTLLNKYNIEDWERESK